jgi:16S rRNA pseudouridine516 synthase
MPSQRTRLDRFISQHTNIKRRDVRLALAQERVSVDGEKATAINQLVDGFSLICLDGEILQQREPVYVMLNKPPGVVSATKDYKHRTVIDLLGRADGTQLHIVGRLDLNSSGLLLLTNDSRWSRAITSPESKVVKRYRVGLEKPLEATYIDAFAAGMYFSYEDVMTRPAQLSIVSDYVAEVSLVEGRYHQIKRMFGRFNNPVIALHRISIGLYLLDENLPVRESEFINIDYKIS